MPLTEIFYNIEKEGWECFRFSSFR